MRRAAPAEANFQALLAVREKQLREAEGQLEAAQGLVTRLRGEVSAFRRLVEDLGKIDKALIKSGPIAAVTVCPPAAAKRLARAVKRPPKPPTRTQVRPMRPAKPGRPGKPGRPPQPNSMIDRIDAVLRAAAAPLDVDEVLHALHKDGHGPAKAATVYALLGQYIREKHRGRSWARYGRGLYGIAGRSFDAPDRVRAVPATPSRVPPVQPTPRKGYEHIVVTHEPELPTPLKPIPASDVKRPPIAAPKRPPDRDHDKFRIGTVWACHNCSEKHGDENAFSQRCPGEFGRSLAMERKEESA